MKLEVEDVRLLAEIMLPMFRQEIEQTVAGQIAALAPKKWMSVEELAEHLGVGRHVITAARERGEIAGVKIGKQWRFDYQEVLSAIEVDESDSRQ